LILCLKEANIVAIIDGNDAGLESSVWSIAIFAMCLQGACSQSRRLARRQANALP